MHQIQSPRPADGLLVAEAVLPGHPDKLADQIADAVLDVALSRDDRAIVQVECAVHDAHCHVNGRVATREIQSREFLEATIRAVYERAGFGRTFPGSADPADWQCPAPADVQLHWAIQLEEADPHEQAERGHADDQAIHIGYAVADEGTRALPVEHHLVLALRDELWGLTERDRALGAGPDGKVLLALRPVDGGRVALDGIVTSVQHLAAASTVLLERGIRAALWARLQAERDALGGQLLLDGWSANDARLRLNPAGMFSIGGPRNDNGQTGRKLVMDFYGPRVPIGGGALSGKDPWRLDRAAALRTRQIALAMVETGFVREALVTFAWGPRDRRPSWVELRADGRVLDARATAGWLKRFDPSLEATWEELGLAGVNWERCAREGHFGRGVPWEDGTDVASDRSGCHVAAEAGAP
ncbi:MAG: methionine adenosyltransferase domain-containing protein [Gemmatimonadota bacterium]